MFPAARATDLHVCPMVTGIVPPVGGPILPPCCLTVLIDGQPAARIADQATVWVNKKLAEIPSGPLITSPVAPYVTPVRAGDKFREEVVVPIPITEYRQYNGEIHAEPDMTPLETYKEIYFSLGYYWRPEGTAEEEAEVHGTPVIIPRPPRASPMEFGILDSDRKQFDLNVKLRGGQ